MLTANIPVGRSISLCVSAKSAQKILRPGQAISFRFDRKGFRSIHIRPPTSFSTSPAQLLSSFSSKRLPKMNTTGRGSLTRPFSSQIPPSPQPTPTPAPPPKRTDEEGDELSESPYTLPNALTLARIIACPFLGYQIVQGDYVTATGLLFACGVSDWLDGYLARSWGGKSVLGSILDPAADKTLMTTLVITLAWAGLLPVPLAVLILGRDVALSLSAFYFRFISLPPPRTLSRYFNPSIPSAEVKPTQISKINTALQLVLMGVTTVSPLITYPIGGPLEALQWVVAGTTIWSGLSYVGKAGVRILPRKGK